MEILLELQTMKPLAVLGDTTIPRPLAQLRFVQLQPLEQQLLVVPVLVADEEKTLQKTSSKQHLQHSLVRNVRMLLFQCRLTSLNPAIPLETALERMLTVSSSLQQLPPWHCCNPTWKTDLEARTWLAEQPKW